MSAAFQEDAQANQGLVDTIVQTVLGMLNEPTSLPQNFKGWIPKYIEVNPPLLPISQISGFARFTAQVADVIATAETTSSTSFTDLATVGPVLAGLPDGQYLFLYGCRSANNTAGSLAEMSIKVNATEAVASDAAASSASVSMSVMRATTKTLSNGGNNTVTARYQANSAGTATFRERWLLGLRFANS